MRHPEAPRARSRPAELRQALFGRRGGRANRKALLLRHLGGGGGPPELAAGLRACVLTSVPMLLAVVLARPSLAWMGLATWLVSLADVGGAYRRRARAMALMTALGAAACLLGSLAGASPWLAVPVMACAGVAFSMLRVVDPVGANVGPLLVVLVAVALGDPAPGLRTALERTGAVVAGGLLTMAVALALWRLTPYRPVRAAVARCWATLAETAGELRRLHAQRAPAGDWDAWVRATPRRMREALEAARAALMATRAGQRAESRAGEQLHVLVALCDQAFETQLALAESLESLQQHGPVPSLDARLDALLALVERRFTQLAAGIGGRREVGPDEAAGSALEAFRRELPSAMQAVPEATRRERLRAQAAYVADRLGAQLHLADMATDAVRAVQLGWRSAPLGRPVREPWGARARARLKALRGQLTPDSRAFRHAVRVGGSAAVAVLLTALLHVEHGAWVTLTTVVILQPSLAATRARATQRLAGSVAGGVLAAVLADVGGRSLLTVLFLAVSIFAARALLPRSYTAFTFFVTPAFVLFAHLTGAGGQLALDRVGASIAGGVLALLSMSLLWPEWARASVRSDVAAALERSRRLFQLVLASVLTGGRAPDARIAEARRQVGLANTNAEDAFQRLLDEEAPDEELREAIFTLTTYIRRFAAAVIALLPAREALEAPALRPRLGVLVRAVDAALVAMGEELRDGGHPGARARTAEHRARLERALDLWARQPEHGAAAGQEWLRSQVERMARQVLVMEAALARLAQAPGATAGLTPGASPAGRAAAPRRATPGWRPSRRRRTSS